MPESTSLATTGESREKATSITQIEDLAASRAEVECPDEEPTSSMIDFKTLWAYTGPGWLMSIAYLDPGNLEADLQSGAYGGYQLIWVLFWATVVGLILQVLALRLGVVTGLNLAEMCRLNYPKSVSMTLWVMTEIAIIGADIQEVVGSAIAFKLLFGWPIWVGVLITGLDTFTFLALHYFGVRKLEYFFAFLIAVMLGCFYTDFAAAKPPASDILGGFVPEVSDYAIVQAIGVLGAVIMPHNVYLHSALVQSRAIDRTKPSKVREANKYFTIEACIALLISFFINLAVVCVFSIGFFDQACAVDPTGQGKNYACLKFDGDFASNSSLVATLRHKECAYDGAYHPCTTFQDQSGYCCPIGLQEAGSALSAILGDGARIVWAIGLLAAGQSSTMTGTYAGQFVMEGFIQIRMAPWMRMAMTRGVALVPALTVALVTGTNRADSFDEWLNVLQAVQLPFALFPILHFTSYRRYMKEFKNGLAMQVVCWSLGLLAIAVNWYNLILEVPKTAAAIVPFVLFAFIYFGFIVRLVAEDVRMLLQYLRARREGSNEDVSLMDGARTARSAPMRPPDIA